MSDPLVPNFNVGVGRLATDRFDFQKHLDGEDFRHDATQIDLTPSVTIDGDVTTTVQGAIAALSLIAFPPVIPDATTSVKGIVQLAGDISGTATSVSVVGLRGRSVANLAPTDGQILTWSSGSSYWYPAAAPNSFTAGTDLSGTSSSQNVIKLTGTAGVLNVDATEFLFKIGINPYIHQTDASISAASDFTIAAQNCTYAGFDGADLILTGGSTNGGLKGGVQISLNDTADTMVQATEVISGQKVLSLVRGSILTLTQMPASSGDGVIYIGNATTDPGSGVPVSGAILYASGGTLRIKQSDATDFKIGSVANPLKITNGGSFSEQTTQVDWAFTFAGVPQIIFEQTLLDNASTRIDVVCVGKKYGTNDSAQYNMSMGYTREAASAPVAIGTVTFSDTRNTAGAAAGWSSPNIVVSGNNVRVYTGYDPIDSTLWTTSVKLVTTGV